jgi:hypothetical protein
VRQTNSIDVARRRLQYLFEHRQYSDAAAAADDVILRSKGPGYMHYRGDAAFLKVEALLLQGRMDEARRAARAALDFLDPRVTSVRPQVEALLLVVGRPSRYADAIEQLPRRAHNDHLLFLAALSFAEGNADGYRKHLKDARGRTVGRNFPYYLIESLSKSE